MARKRLTIIPSLKGNMLAFGQFVMCNGKNLQFLKIKLHNMIAFYFGSVHIYSL